LTSENCERDKRNYTKNTNEYWSDIIFKQRAAKKAKIYEEMSLVADKYSENDPVPCSIDDLSVTEIRDELDLFLNDEFFYIIIDLFYALPTET
jgi:hypothetical protein